MKLSPLERLNILSILPNEGNYLTLKIVRKLREALSFDEQEHKILKFVQEEGVIKWDTQNDFEKDITIGEKATDLIVEALKKIDEKQKLTEQLYSIYEKFVISPGE